MDPTN
jgi:hypothetical protein